MAYSICLFVVGCAAESAVERPPADGKGDGSWHHRKLVATDGTSVAVDFQLKFEDYSSNKPHTVYFVQPLWFNVAGPSVSDDSQIRVVFTNRVVYDGSCGSGDRVDERAYQLDLELEPEGHFAGELDSQGTLLGTTTPITGFLRPIAKNMPYCTTGISEGSSLAVVIDGAWLTDPINGSHNFGVSF
jgi:hypothetical protein